MVSPDDVATSKAIQQRTGKTFHVATRVLPERVRRATYVLYAFFRVADDVVDDPGEMPAAEQRRELDRIRAAAVGDRDTDDPVLDAFRDLAEQYGIPDEEIHTFVDAMEMDVDTRRYETRADLDAYLRGSSVSVGYMMLDVMAGDGMMTDAEVEAARPHARALGEAFQLTNFLRDVREDARDHGRVYLPRATLADHDVTVAEVKNCEYSARFAAALRSELERTEERYREGVAGIEYLPEDCQFAVLVSAVLYADHHRLVRARDYDTLTGRPTLSMRRRLALLARTWYHWRRADDPVEAFHAVSAVPASPRETQARATASGDRTPGATGEDHAPGSEADDVPPASVCTHARSAAGSLASLLGGSAD